VHLTILIALLAVPSISLIVYSGIAARREAITTAKAECLRFVDDVAGQQQAIVAGAEQLATALSLLPSIQSRNPAAAATLFSELLRQNPQYANIVVTDKSGLIWASAAPLPGKVSVANRRVFQAAARTGMFSSDEYSIGPITGKPTIAFGYPLKNAAHEFTGMIAIVLDLGYTRRMFEKLRLPPGSLLALLDHRGIILARNVNNSSENLSGGPDLQRDLFTRMTHGPDEGTFEAMGNDGRFRLRAYKRISLPQESEPYLYIRSGIPLASATSRANAVMFRNLSAFVSLFLIGSFLAWYIGKRLIVTPAVMLKRAAGQLAANAGAMNVSSVVRGGELGEVARAFDGMAEALVQRESALRESETKFRAILDGSRDAIGVSKDGIRIFVNPAFVSLFGYESADELIGKPIFDVIAPESRELVEEMMTKHARGEPGPSFYEETALKKDGTAFLVEVSASTYALKGERFTLGILRDITERRRAEEQLLHDALYDGLTGLPNRALFMDRLGHALRRANRKEKDPCAVIFLDLDRFKVVNDSLGHMVGDRLLKEAARRLERCIRPADTVARLGGDEFAILLEDVKEVEDAKAIAHRIQEVLSAPFFIEGKEIRCSASFGIALTSKDHELPEEVLRDADITMYRAKALGKARYEVFDPAMRLEAAAVLQLENDLRRALEMDELRMHYQPIVALADERIVGVEALLRWEHPHRGIVCPDQFIPLAEETGLIVPIGEWVLRKACAQMKAWRDRGAGPMRVAINISAVQIRQSGFVDLVEKVVRETGMEPELLDLEITESVLMGRNDSVVETFLALRTLGVRICLDDFGTGYSSLSYLQGLPISVLKIDRSFTMNLAAVKENRKIVETILMLGRSLGAEVIAEGIETHDQLSYLREIGCDCGQGFFFSKPVDEKGLEPLIDIEVGADEGDRRVQALVGAR